ncbi:MAG: helix-turn-helix domain-containing protein [Catenulispora sp.]|nr:helix-turn-helix domain-containing protein [Catenulispora sp.]
MTEQHPELGRFLRARRAAVAPADLGLPAGTGTRRTPGLRREELAALAGVSIDYYIRLERGKETRPSPAVVDALGHALRLDAEELAYLRELAAHAARGGRAPSSSRPAASRVVRPTLRRLLETVRPYPAYVLNRTNDMLAANPSGLSLHPGMAGWPEKQRNTIRYTFLHTQAHTLWPDWEVKARSCVAHLRAVGGSDPDNPELAALVGELAVKSPEFSRMWERYDVRRVGNGQKTFRHPEVGTLTLSHEVLEINGTAGGRLVVYSAEPGTPDHDAVVLLDMQGAPAAVKAGTGSRAGDTGVQKTDAQKTDAHEPCLDEAGTDTERRSPSQRPSARRST